MEVLANRIITHAPAKARGFEIPPATARMAFLIVIALTFAMSVLTPDRGLSMRAEAVDGPSLVQLLRAMAAIKVSLAAVAAAAVYWRLGAAIGAVRLTALLAAGGAMAAGPGLIWRLAHVAAGAELLHGGLFATILLLWRDPGMAERLDNAIMARRVSLARR